MNTHQAGILAAVPPVARYLQFALVDSDAARTALRVLRESADGDRTVVGIGASAAHALGVNVPGLRTLAARSGAGFEVPSTPGALWCWLRGEDAGELFHRARRIESAMAPAFRLESSVGAFVHQGGRDLTGYEDGTENPRDDDAVAAAILHGQPEALDGSSFVAVQQWLHDFGRFDGIAPAEQDAVIGRRRGDNAELEDAPESAHVKRTAQENFEPEAFVLRRSMPWAAGSRAGLMFVAFGKSFDAFEAQLKRMTGEEDGIADALFRFTRPVTGAYFWCPGMRDGKLDLRLLGL